MHTQDKDKIKESYSQYAKIWSDMRSGQSNDKKIAKANRPHKYIEKPAMYSISPNLKGKKVLCIGCGTGEECHMLIEKGANEVIGVDLSDGLIALAKENYPNIAFKVMDMEELTFEDNEFDFIYSSLTMHYAPSWAKALSETKRVLKLNHLFQFSTAHTIKWRAEKHSSNQEVK